MRLKIVVDTNIIFSAILNPENRIAKILINSKEHFQFYSCEFLKIELTKHQTKLLKFSRLNVDELQELISLVTKKVIFINDSLLPKEIIVASEAVLEKIDLNDTPFVALTRHLNAKLWTGDKGLASGLKMFDYIETITTHDLYELLDQLESNI